LLRIQSQPLDWTRVGLELLGRRPARENCPILLNGTPIGHTTSGTHSPTLQKPIAMGYIRPEHGQPGTEVTIDVRGRLEPARVVQLPFYRHNHVGHPGGKKTGKAR